MSCHGGNRGDQTWKYHTELGRFLAMHPVHSVTILDCSSASSGVTTYSAEARFGDYIGSSDPYWRTPEDAIMQAVLRARVMAGHPKEYAEEPSPRVGLNRKPRCLLCAREAKKTRVANRKRVPV